MSKIFHKRSHHKNPHLLLITLPIFFFIWLTQMPTTTHLLTSPSPTRKPDCSGRNIYIQNLPKRFNSDILADCTNFDPWYDMCYSLENSGLGPHLAGARKIFSPSGWFATSQFSLEVIFHQRMMKYACVTNNSSSASAVYVPYYGGADISRYLWGYNISYRDAGPEALLTWLKGTPEWTAAGGRDHFLVSGRITWDFRRETPGERDWGSRFLLMEGALNLTVLDIEASQWHGNEVAIPYPTYFHPSRDGEVVEWQRRMRGFRRPWLFSFAGRDRPWTEGSIRGRLIEQCRVSKRCKLLSCEKKKVVKCNDPRNIMQLFESSVFCLQPPGDSYTRRSTFDSMLAGCIPVFFNRGSAYEQYVWHLPKNFSSYSVFISEDDVRDRKVDIEEVLRGFSEEEVRRMREEVVRIVPRLVYADPRGKLETVKDAFDYAIEGMIERLRKKWSRGSS